jgi:predicted Rossmann-fold nucleotide-binding protein
MATWSQLAIHKRKVLLLNVEGFYTPLREQIARATKDGFITANNSRLVRFLDGPGEDEQEAWDWGKEALGAMERWEWDESAGYAGLTWESS